MWIVNLGKKEKKLVLITGQMEKKREKRKKKRKREKEIETQRKWGKNYI